VKVILRDNVPNLGSMGDTVKVADGYARNYLLPRRLAVPIDSGSARQIEHEVRMIRKREEKRRVELREVATAMQKLTVEVRARAGEEEKIFGSVTAANIAEKLKEQGYDVEKRSIKLEEPIKALGIYSVPVNLGHGVEASVKVWVAPIEEEAKAEAAE
jgi:large subunit ribosomal protein L9